MSSPTCRFIRPPPDSAGDEISAGTAQEARRICAGAHRQAGRRSTCRSWIISPNFSKARRAEISTTIAFGTAVAPDCCSTKALDKKIVPIIPDEARTFGMDALFREIGIYSSERPALRAGGQQVAARIITKPRTARFSRKASAKPASMSSFIAAGTSYATHGVPMIPFYIYYSMFGPQRVGDLFWLAGDIRAKGFLLGATSGRTTLNGEGLQHQDGHSLLHASTIPTCLPYDPAFALRTRGDHRRRFAPDVRRGRGDFLLPLRSTTKIIRMPPMPPASKTAS